MKSSNLKKYLFEFLSVFFAVMFAFLLNKWNEGNKERLSERTILKEIYHGLERDSIDLSRDEQSTKHMINAVDYFRRISDNIEVDTDSLARYYLFLTRDFVTIQNTSGYETLKSVGLEIIQNDSLRKTIIDLYEVQYKLYKKFIEDYDENRYMRNYFEKINNAISPHFVYDSRGNIIDLKQPINLREEERSLVKSYLWRLQFNRLDRSEVMKSNQKRIGKVRQFIWDYIKNN